MYLSICMCTYNGEKYIREQLDSIVNQTRQADEIIVYDDCSTDGTVKILHEYAEKYTLSKWIIVVNPNNQGWKRNFKSAIDRASGDYIFLCDQDDIWMEDKLEMMSNILEQNPKTEVLTCSTLVYYEETNHCVSTCKNDNSILKVTADNCLTYTARPGCAFAVRKSIVEIFDQIWHPDFPHDAILWKIAYLRETLYDLQYEGIKWRRHSSCATNKTKDTFSQENIQTHYEVIGLYQLYFEHLKKISGITVSNRKKIANVDTMLNLRRNLYETGSLASFMKLAKYSKYYASKKAYLFDALALTNLNTNRSSI